MSRLVETRPRTAFQGQAKAIGAGKDRGLPEPPPAAAPKLQEYGERVAKYVPAEILAFYVAAINLVATVPATDRPKRLLLFGAAGVIAWVATPLWIRTFTADPRVRRINQIMATVAFLFWAFSIPAGWFQEQGYYDPVLAGFALLVFSLVSAFVPARPAA